MNSRKHLWLGSHFSIEPVLVHCSKRMIEGTEANMTIYNIVFAARYRDCIWPCIKLELGRVKMMQFSQFAWDKRLKQNLSKNSTWEKWSCPKVGIPEGSFRSHELGLLFETMLSMPLQAHPPSCHPSQAFLWSYDQNIPYNRLLSRVYPFGKQIFLAVQVCWDQNFLPNHPHRQDFVQIVS